jgi:DNA-binding GntR family transcriptional regulator
VHPSRQRDLLQFYASDEDFHHAIARISQHEDVWQVIRPTKIHLDRVRHLTLIEEAGHIPLLIEQHREILGGLADCNEERAVAAMRRHLARCFAAPTASSPAKKKTPPSFR